MKKYFSVLLCFAVLVVSALSFGGFSFAAAEGADSFVFSAENIISAPDMSVAITEEAWGKATVSIDKNTYNTGLTKYNGDPEDVSADMYFRWDSENLYIGVKTPDSDVTGWSQNYVGDGLQFKLQAGDAITSEAADICLTWGKNGFDATVGGESFKVRGSGDNIEALNQNTRFNIVNEDGSMSIMLAIRHADMGYTADEIKSGATYAMSMLRISGRGGESASEEQAYSGWLDWGRYWDESSSLYNANCVSNSIIVLGEQETAPANVFEAEKTLGAISTDGAITEEAWGKATVSIDKNTYNTGLTKYNGDPEDVSADMYFRWDSENLYIGVKTPDSDVTGWSQNYVGDGLQFKLQAGDAITSEAADICLTWGKNGFDATVGGESFKVRGSGDNIEALNQNTRFNIVNEDGSMSIMLAIRHTDMGYTADEIKAGATYAMSMLRISGRGGDNASEEQAYSGWLDWGRYWDESSSLYNANCVSNSVIVLGEQETAPANMFEAEKTLGAISTDGAITEEAWGKATVSIDKNTYNTGLTKYNGDPEDVSADMYFRWDSENLYIGVKTPDSDVTGWSQNYVGDGLQFKLQAGDAITSEAADICLTWGKNGFDTTVGGESFKVRGSGDNIEALNQNTRFNIINEDGSMSIMLAIRHTDMGYTADEIKAGATYAMSMLRISGRGGDNASEEQAYSGWLDWGRYWDESSSLYNANCVSNSVIVLHEKDGAASNNAEADYESALIDITAAVGGSVSKAGFGDGMKVVSTDFGSYVVYMTNSGIFDSTANGYNALNEFVLFEIGEDTVAQLGMFYTRTGDVDILSANDGTVYIVGGSSSHVIKELAVHGYDSSLESAVVNIWKYTESNGAVNGRTTQIPFESSKGYEYINTVMSNDGTKIYTFFASGSSLAWSVYDTASQVWDAEMHYASLTGSIDKSFAFGTSDGILFVYASGSSIYTLDIQSNSANTIVSDSASELKDAYIDANGQLRLLYAATDGKVYLFGTDVVEVADMTASDYGRICSDANGAVSVLAMESGKPASVKVISENLLVNTIVLDSRAAASAAPIIAAPRNGSNADDSVKIVFPAPYRTGNHWYYAELTLN